MNKLLSECVKIVRGVDPVADAFAGTVTSDYVSLALYNRAAFVVEKGAGGTGTSTITLQAASDSSGTGAEAIAFKYRRASSGDTLGDVTAATSSGFATSANANEHYVIEVQAADLPEDKPWLALVATEVVDSPVAGSVLILLSEPRYGGDDLPTAIA